MEDCSVIGLSFLARFGIWITVAVMLSKRVPQWVGVKKYTKTLSVLVFPLVIAAPFVDDLIGGRWQFYRLCDRAALVTLSPDWKNVRRAIWQDAETKYINDYLIPVTSQGGKYVDRDTGKVFMSFCTLFTSGGFLRRNVYGLSSQGPACHPKNIQEVQRHLNFSGILK